MITVRGYRVKGGAVVVVLRSDRDVLVHGRVRRYRVSGSRFSRLRRCLSGTPGWGGTAFSGSFCLTRVAA